MPDHLAHRRAPLSNVRAVTLPPDPAAFVAAAERGINDRDLAGTIGVYSRDVLLEALTDGGFESHRGIDEVRRAWDAYLAAMDARGFALRKRLTAVEGDTIVNEWTGTLGGRTEAEGIERWTFDHEGKVREHRMYSYFNVKPMTHPLARLRLALSYPLSALAFLREQRRRGR